MDLQHPRSAADPNPADSRKRAEAVITVKDSTAEPFAQEAGPRLLEVRIRESFAGDLEGESTVRALQVQGEGGRASMVSLQRFCGRLAGRQGAFVLQGAEMVENGEIKATWFVVPGSGAGELAGLRGEGGFEGRVGEGSRGTLDYWFE